MALCHLLCEYSEADNVTFSKGNIYICTFIWFQSNFNLFESLYVCLQLFTAEIIRKISVSLPRKYHRYTKRKPPPHISSVALSYMSDIYVINLNTCGWAKEEKFTFMKPHEPQNQKFLTIENLSLICKEKISRRDTQFILVAYQTRFDWGASWWGVKISILPRVD